MSQTIYLTDVELSNFRSFGPGQHISLPAEPGLIVVAGPNGLGKTSLFEGIEWALTGTVRRLMQGGREASEVERVLTRRHQPVGSHHVALSFSDGGRVVRGPDETTPMEQIVGLLKDDRWRHAVEDLGSYLGMTHFLSQSAMLRLTARQPEDRWNDLRQPAGMDGVDRILRNLGQGTKQHFTRRLTSLTQEHQTLEKRRAELLRLTERVAQMSAAVATRDALPPSQVVEEIRVVLGRLDVVTGADTPVPNQPDAALAELLAGLASARQSLEQCRETLVIARKILSDLAALDEEAKNIEITKRRSHLPGLVNFIFQISDSTTEVVFELENMHTQQHEHLRYLTDRRDRLYQQRQALERLPNVEAEIATLATQMTQAQAGISAATKHREQLARIKETFIAMDQAIHALRQREEVIKNLIEEEIKIRNTLDEVAEDRALYVTLNQQYNDEMKRLERLADEAAKAEVNKSLAHEELSRLRAELDERARLAAELASRLQPEDSECPVCATRFAPGKLLRRAREMVGRNDERLKAAQSKFDGLNHKYQDSQAALRQFADIRTHLIAQITDKQKRIIDADQLAAQFQSHPLIVGRPLDGLGEWLRERQSAVVAERQRYGKERRALDPQGTIDKRLMAAETDQKTLDAAFARIRDQHASTEAARDALRAVLGVSPDVVAPAPEREMAEVLKSIEQAEREIPGIEAALALGRRAQQIQTLREAMLLRWQAAGLSGGLSEKRADALSFKIVRDEQVVDYTAQRHEQLALRYRNWLSHEDLQKTQRDLASFLTEEDAPDAVACEAKLQQRIDDLQKHRQSWDQARGLIDTVEQHVQKNQDRMLHEVIEPLQQRVKAFDRAWSAFPELDLGMALPRRHGKRSMAFTVDRHDAEMILSEGQAGVKSLSYLLGASTAYPWSRWRALLLDDPFQYNDLIHKAAFLDVLRALIQDQGYQVLLSTHDLDEAQFIGRKCRNAGIGFHLCRLRTVGRDGVDLVMDQRPAGGRTAGVVA